MKFKMGIQLCEVNIVSFWTMERPCQGYECTMSNRLYMVGHSFGHYLEKHAYGFVFTIYLSYVFKTLGSLMNHV